MLKQVTTILSVLIIYLLSVNPSLAGEVAVGLQKVMLQNGADEYIPVIIFLTDRVNAPALAHNFDLQHQSLKQRHESIVRILQNKASEKQREVIPILEDYHDNGLVRDYTPLWITNAIGAAAKKQAIAELSSLPQIETIIYDAEIELIKPVDNPVTDFTNDIQTVETGLSAIRADEVWAMGITGEGVLVSHLDTGVDGHHAALRERWRGNDTRYDGHPEWAWHDPLTNTGYPFDDGYHGTHTMGTICGRASSTGDTIGVAIDAEWISAGVIDRGGNLPTRMLRYMQAFQWVADPDGNPETLWDVPAVCSNSWGHSLSGFPGDECNDYYWETLDNLEAAGVCVVFAAGNEGMQGLRIPANRATDDYRNFAVGAVDGSNPNFPIANFSARGPSICTPDGSPATKPEIVAPGVNVRSAYPGGTYSMLSGTSMACPHIAGVIALMKDANPDLTPEEIKQVLMDTAVDLGDMGEDNTYGWGIVDAYEAVNMAFSMLEGYGYVHGTITDLITADPLPATVTILNHPDQLQIAANQDGTYGFWIPSDSVWNLAVEYPPNYLPFYQDITVAEHETLSVDFQLEPKVEVILRASFGNPEDITYRAFYCKGSWDDQGIYDENWSSSFAAMRDDGAYPDQSAGDGIFTGSVKLAADTDNSYEWAVYSENYSDSALLQLGNPFMILSPDYNPNVPILNVNPSGNEHNWTLTVYGDNSLLAELNPGYDDSAHLWAGEAYLNANTTYTFRIYPMHADIASYGKDGIEGEDYVITPNYGEDYTFIFNDLNDSLTLTSAHPSPSDLTATEDMDSVIALNWQAPDIQPLYYKLYRSENEPGPFDALTTIPYPDTSYNDEAVENYHNYYYYLTAAYTGDIESIPSNIAHGYAMTGARMDVTPNEYLIELDAGEVINRSLYISNQGDLDLTYCIEINTEDNLSAAAKLPTGNHEFTRIVDHYDKSDLNEHQQNPPQINGSGGPDEYGYTWIDSDEPGGPLFNWVEITDRGELVVMDDDDNQGPFQLPFNVNFYGMGFDSYRICSNGFVSFTSAYTDYYNKTLPNPSAPGNLLAGFWNDLNPLNGGEIYHFENSDSAIVSFIGVPRYNDGGSFTFQIIILSSGAFIYQYQNMDGTTDYCTVGIQNDDGSDGLQVVYNQEYIHENLAVKFQTGWLRAEPLGGNILPGSVDTVTVSFDASNIPAGEYHGYIDLFGYDIYHEEDMVRIPVTMVVDQVVGIDEVQEAGLPREFKLYQNYPNPFNPSTEIRYDLPAASDVKLEIFNMLGQRISVPVNERQNAGSKHIHWIGRDSNGNEIASGVYFYRLRAGEYVQTRKMLLLK